MKILITGGTGFIGKALTARLRDKGHAVVLVSRKPKPGTGAISYHDSAPAVEAVINLAGESVAGLWTSAKKKRILGSRVMATRWCVEQMKRMTPQPRVFLSASAIGIYGHRPGEQLTEQSALSPTPTFRAEVCRAWEAAAQEAQPLGIRTVLMRFSQVLHPEGGYLQPLLPLYRHGLCIGLGQPSAGFSWISREDLIRAMELFLTDSRAADVFNLTAPGVCTQQEFAQALAQRLGKKFLFFLPPWMLRLGLGEFADALLEDERMISEKLPALGFRFKHPTIQEALV